MVWGGSFWVCFARGMVVQCGEGKCFLPAGCTAATSAGRMEKSIRYIWGWRGFFVGWRDADAASGVRTFLNGP